MEGAGGGGGGGEKRKRLPVFFPMKRNGDNSLQPKSG